MAGEVLILFDEAMASHDPGPGHPERPARLRAIGEMLGQLKLEGVRREQPRPATREQIERVHDPGYVEFIESLRGRSARLDVDTAASAMSVDAAHLAAGAAIDAVNAVMKSASAAFAMTRPPGHHAERDRAMGFCLFNNIAVAAAHAIAEHGCERVLIVDWDVHHGNGTQQIFEDCRDVLYFSTHQWPLYPGTGAAEETGRGEGEGFTVNVPLPGGLDDAAHAAIYQQLLVPIADQYQPDLVLVSAGFDSHQEDPLGGMRMTERGFAALYGVVRDIADRYAGGRLALMLEGGYSLAALAGSARACIEILAGAAPPAIESDDGEVRAVIKRVREIQRKHWRM